MKYLFLYITFLCVGCASINPLDGGLKDEQAPVVTYSFPDSAQLNVTTNEIRIRFDEYVSAKNMRDLLIISPSLESDPETEIKKKTLYIRFDDSLRSNTTYSVLLNGSIVDYNEGNVLENYQLSFSTGDYLDSLSYKAVLIDAYTKEACTDCFIALYTTENDSAPLLQKPVYLGRANNGGMVAITNLAAGIYKAIALKDANKNLKLEDQEQVSLFRDIQLTDSTTKDSFYTFPYFASTSNKATLHRSYPGVVKVSFEHPVDNALLVKQADKNISFLLNAKRDTLTTHINAAITDTFAFSIWIDTTEQKLRYTSSKLPKHIKVQGQWVNKSSISLSAEQLMNNYRLDDIKLWVDSSLYSFDSATLASTKLLLYSNKLKGRSCRLILADSSIQDFNLSYALKDTLHLGAYLEPETNLIVNLKLKEEGSYIFQLLKKDQIQQQMVLHQSKKLVFDNLKAGTYRIRIIRDTNENMIWDTGDFLLDQPAESIFLSELIELRSNWDKELTINY